MVSTPALILSDENRLFAQIGNNFLEESKNTPLVQLKARRTAKQKTRDRYHVLCKRRNRFSVLLKLTQMNNLLIAGLAALILAGPTLVAGHGGLVNPPSRNSVDRQLPTNQRLPSQPCDCANTTAVDGTCDLAQACYWYSQGCTVSSLYQFVSW